MAEEAQGEVAQDDVSRMARFLDKWNPEDPRGQEPSATAPPGAEPSQAQGQPAATEQQPPSPAELTPADLPEETAETPQPVALDAFEITHNGTQHKLNRDELIKYAQQGFDYTQKTEGIAARERAVQEQAQRTQELEQIQTVLADDLGAVKALGQQLQQYQNVNWLQLAATDSASYSQAHAAYMQLSTAYNQAAQMLEQKVGAVKQARNQMLTDQLQREAARLPEFIPDWKDSQKYATGREEVLTYLVGELKKAGMDPSQLGSRLDNALAVAISWKAMKYDQLRAAKATQSKRLQNVPPMTKPGAAQPANAAQAEQQKTLGKRLAKSGTVEDAAALLLSRMR